MKTSLKFIAAVFLIFSLISSCHTVYYSNPLPVDSRNIYKIPRGYRGVWFIEFDSIIIGKRNVSFISSQELKVAKSEVDTRKQYLWKDNLIYYIDSVKGLSAGFPYVLLNDTFYYKERTLTNMPLSPTTVLRKVHGGYLLNLSGTVLEMEIGGWHQSYYLEKLSDEEFILSGIDYKTIAGIQGADLVYQTEYDHYYNAAWTKKEMDSIIKLGYFSDTIFEFRKTKYNVSHPDSFNFEISIPLDSLEEKSPVDNEGDW